MKNKAKFVFLGLGILGVSSCATMDDYYGRDNDYSAYTAYENSRASLQDNLNSNNYYYKYQPKQDVIVPDSYHLGYMRSPVSFQDRDQSWASSQNPQSYTIELAEGDKAAQVAQVLYKAPKKNRMAQMKYQRNGKNYYRGVYGSFSSAEEAQKALNVLPADIKKSASIKSWASVKQ